MSAQTEVAKHTPGPWHLEASGPVSGKFTLPVFAEVRPGQRWSVAHANGVDGEARANARLIAAAPELLVALRAMLGIDNPAAPDAGHVDYVRAVSLARAAIAKAEGSRR